MFSGLENEHPNSLFPLCRGNTREILNRFIRVRVGSLYTPPPKLHHVRLSVSYTRTVCIPMECQLSYGSFTLPDSDSDSDSEGFPFGYNCNVLNVHIAQIQTLIPIPMAALGIRVRIRVWQCKRAITLHRNIYLIL